MRGSVQNPKSTIHKNKGFASWHILIALALLAGILLFIQRRAANRDFELALGPPSAVQTEFFAQAAERPDLDLFFKALKPEQRLTMARNLGEEATPGATKTAARLLSTIDDAAREELTHSLSKIAIQKPDLVAAELGRSGSFERAGIFKALTAAGNSAIEAAAQSLSDPGRRENAILFLVQAKDGVAEIVLPLLDDKNAETRSAAAETLGKLGAKEAVEPLLSKLANTSGPEHDAYLSGLADIGDSRAESVLQAAIENGNADKSARLLAGLGRIATPSSIRRLKMICLNGKKDLRQAALEGLILAGDLALTAIKGPALRLEIAARLHSAQADQAIAQALSDPSLTAKAIDAAKGREALVESIWPTAMLPNDPTISRRMTVLASTIRGRDILKKLSTQPTFMGLAKRALALATELSEMHQN